MSRCLCGDDMPGTCPGPHSCPMVSPEDLRRIREREEVREEILEDRRDDWEERKREWEDRYHD